MADKAIGELIAATQITPTDLLVMEQNGTAKSVSGQVLINFLTAIADGHGGIQSIELAESNVLKDTYRITLADTTTFDFVVTNGRSITGIAKTSTEGLVDTYTVSYNDGTSDTITVTNGAKGETGAAWYVWVKYASQEPTAGSHSFGDLPDAWMGVYSGTSATAPTDWTQYRWFEIKGQPGNTGAPATLVSAVAEYQVSDSGTIIPSGSWVTTIPVVAQGRYLWTRTTQTFNTGEPVVSYSVSRMGIDGTGSVSSVAGVSPDVNGNVPLTAENVGALPTAGGNMLGPINMNGQKLNGLNAPVENAEAANKGYVDKAASKAGAPRNLLDNSDFRNPVNQRGLTTYPNDPNAAYTIDRWRRLSSLITVTVNSGSVKLQKTSEGTGSSVVQYLPEEKTPQAGAAVTAALQTADGTIYVGAVSMPNSGYATAFTTIEGIECRVNAPADGSNARFTLMLPAGSAIDLVWAALYEGKYTAETLPKYQPKGYAAELLECQRYYINFPTIGSYNLCFAAGATIASTTIARAALRLPCKMRVIPSITVPAEITWSMIAEGQAHTVTGIEVFKESGNTLYLTVTGTDFPLRQPYSLNFAGVTGETYYIELSADL